MYITHLSKEEHLSEIMGAYSYSLAIYGEAVYFWILMLHHRVLFTNKLI